MPRLFDEPGLCCGCQSCLEACPTGAIGLTEDGHGFTYPVIDVEKCIGCGRCKRVCGFQRGLGQQSRGPFYAAATEEAEIMESSSGGVFGALARALVERGGVVFGCALDQWADGIHVRHRPARTKSELKGLYGSKYVQSSSAGCYRKVERALRAGRDVLFSGTPCQVAGLKGFLGREYDGLLTVDIVCHGVPSERMLRDYLTLTLPDREIIDVRFRGKRNGWNGSRELELICSNGDSRDISCDESSYYDLFYDCMLSRDSCYECPFAGALRPADLSLGDFWGIEKVRPDLLAEAGGPFDVRRGVSCLLVNNERGEAWLERLGQRLVTAPVTFGQIAEHNDQLRNPAARPSGREAYLDAFATGGWPAVERLWRRAVRRRRVLGAVKRCVPAPLKRALGR